MSLLAPVTFCGRTFTVQEVELMREVADDYPGLGVTEIARTVCAASECEPLELALVEGAAESRLWREHVERYHYLGCRVPFGSNLRYWVRNRQRELACLLWTSPAWKMKPRDSWIGWSDQQRQRHLQGIVNNGRFLILPWVLEAPRFSRTPGWTPCTLSYWRERNSDGSWHSTTELLPHAYAFKYLTKSKELKWRGAQSLLSNLKTDGNQNRPDARHGRSRTHYKLAIPEARPPATDPASAP